jgi:hypothetical protein
MGIAMPLLKPRKRRRNTAHLLSMVASQSNHSDFLPLRPTICNMRLGEARSVTNECMEEMTMRREYIEDAVLVLGGGTFIAGAWIVYWPAGLMVAGVVFILFAILAVRHRRHHTQHPAPAPHAASHDHLPHGPLAASHHAEAPMSAAAWRFHHHTTSAHEQPAHRRTHPG